MGIIIPLYEDMPPKEEVTKLMVMEEPMGHIEEPDVKKVGFSNNLLAETTAVMRNSLKRLFLALESVKKYNSDAFNGA
jgi:hypothetical protein